MEWNKAGHGGETFCAHKKRAKEMVVVGGKIVENAKLA